MSYVEKQQHGSEAHYYFVKKISFMKSQLLIKEHIGKQELPAAKYLLDHHERLVEREFALRKEFLEQLDISYSDLPERVERKAIKIENLIDAKNIAQEVHIEFAKEFIFNSNTIEGSRIPPERVKEIIDTGDTQHANKNEIREVHNSIRAYNYLLDGFRFNLASIKRLYYILTDGLVREGGGAYPRGFKTEPIVVGNEKTTPPEHVQKELEALLTWYKQNRKTLHPLQLAFTFHQRYEAIHPFSDANGRTGRLLMNKILRSGKYPPIIVYKENKQAYFNAIKKAREGNEKKYMHFMLTQADKSYSWLLTVTDKY